MMGIAGFSTGFVMLFTCRVLAGIGLGGLVPVATSYLSEFIPARLRGRSLSFLNALFGFGTGFSYIIGFAVVVPIAWNYGFWIGAIPIILAVIAWFYLPESTRYLVQKGKIKEAAENVDMIEKKVLGHATVSIEDAIRIEEEARASNTPAAKVPIADLFKKDIIGTTILMSVMWFCLAYATFGLLTWLPTLLATELHYDIGSGLLWLAIVTFIAAVIAPVAGVLADTIGRKKTILCVYILFAVATLLLFNFGGVAGKFFMCLMAIGINMCNAVNYVYVPENFPTRVRATGVGFASAVGRAGSMIGPTLLAILLTVGDVNLVVYVNMGALLFAALIVQIFGKETKGRTLEQIKK